MTMAFSWKWNPFEKVSNPLEKNETDNSFDCHRFVKQTKQKCLYILRVKIGPQSSDNTYMYTYRVKNNFIVFN